MENGDRGVEHRIATTNLVTIKYGVVESREISFRLFQQLVRRSEKLLEWARIHPTTDRS